jgi:hypothetical protein
VKTVTNDNGGTAVVTDWTLSAAGLTPLSGPGGVARTAVMAGEYELSESGDSAGYTAGSWSCSDGVLAENVVSLAMDDDAVCTINNDDNQVLGPAGSLTIIKETVAAGGTGFGFDAGSLGTFTLDDGGSMVFSELEAGAYTVTEVAADGWTFTEAECTAGDWSQSGASVTVNLAEGEAAVCTFTNTAEDTEGPGGELPYTGSDPFMMPLLIGGLWSMLLGLGLMVWSTMRKVRA